MKTLVQVRGLAHPAHWQGPLGSTFERFGAVKATPRAAFRLLQAGEAVLLFPGGGREVRRTVASPHPLDISWHLGSQVSWLPFTAQVRAALCGLCRAAVVVALSYHHDYGGKTMLLFPGRGCKVCQKLFAIVLEVVSLTRFE